MYLRYGAGNSGESEPVNNMESKMQHRQRKRKRALGIQSNSSLRRRQEGQPPPADFVQDSSPPASSLIPSETSPSTDSIIFTPAPEPTNIALVPQLTTITLDNGSITVQEALVVVTGTSNQIEINRTSLITDSSTPTTRPRPPPTTSTQPSETAVPENNTSPTNGFSPIFIFVLVLVLVLGTAFLITSVVLYRRSQKRKREEALNRKLSSKEKNNLVRPDTSDSETRRPESPLPPPPPPPLSPGPERQESMLTRATSELLPSPMVAIPQNAYDQFNFPQVPVREASQSSQHGHRRVESEYDYATPTTKYSTNTVDSDGRARKASSVFGLSFDQHYSLQENATQLRVIDMAESNIIPRRSDETERGIALTVDTSVPAPLVDRLRQRSYISMESAIDPELNYHAGNGFRISANENGNDSSASSLHGMYKNPNNYPGPWGDYDLTQETPTTAHTAGRGTAFDGESLRSPKLSPLGQRSIWEDALMDVDLDGRSKAPSSRRPS